MAHIWSEVDSHEMSSRVPWTKAPRAANGATEGREAWGRGRSYKGLSGILAKMYFYGLLS